MMTLPTTPTNPPYLYAVFRKYQQVSATMKALNVEIQRIYDSLNLLTLPIYTNWTGEALDFIAQNLYGFSRPWVRSGTVTPYLSTVPDAPVIDTLPPDAFKQGVSATVTLLNDDYFKRLLMWHLYRGDGDAFNIQWLKRRVMRFIQDDMFSHVNGIHQVSISLSKRRKAPSIGMADYTPLDVCPPDAYFNTDNQVIDSFNNWHIKITTYSPQELDRAIMLKWLIMDNLLEIPLQNTYTIEVL
jgi:hypothetical protein